MVGSKDGCPECGSIDKYPRGGNCWDCGYGGKMSCAGCIYDRYNMEQEPCMSCCCFDKYEKIKPKITYTFPDDHHETLRFDCPCGRTAERTIDLSCGGEIKTPQEREVLEAAEIFILNTCDPVSYQALLTEIRKLKEQKEGKI